MKYIITIKDKQYEVEVEQGEAKINNTTQVAIASPTTTQPITTTPTQTQQAVATNNNDPNATKAPMPGLIVDIKVNIGQSVKSGDILLTLEAMKMENEIRADRSGTISQIFVKKGENVETGTNLISY